MYLNDNISFYFKLVIEFILRINYIQINYMQSWFEQYCNSHSYVLISYKSRNLCVCACVCAFVFGVQYISD